MGSHPGSRCARVWNVPEMEHVKDSVGIDANGTANGRSVCSVTGGVNQFGRGWRHGIILVGARERILAAFAANALGYVRTFLSDVAGLAWVGCVSLVNLGGVVRGSLERPVRVGPVSLRIGASFGLGGGGVALLARSIA